MIPEWLLQWVGTVFGGVALLWVGWQKQARDKRDGDADKRMTDLERRQNALDLQMVRDLPSRDDFDRFSAQIFARLDKIDDRVQKLNDIVIQLETQGKMVAQHAQG